MRASVDPGRPAGVFRLGYRPALDGIRGVGIILVVVFHTMTYLVDWYSPYGESVLPGAFLAVDVFFALSGFLITTLLLEEHRRYGAISLRRFYIRRSLRLLPALFGAMALFAVFVAVSSAAGLREYAGAAAKMLTYSANWFIGDDVFLTTWFGQTWSLAIEEQFYIVWPLAMIGLLAGFGRRPVALAGLLAAAVVGLIGWRIVLIDRADGLWSEVYYRTDARLDQLLIGALLAVALHHGLLRDRSRAGVGALALAVWAVLTWVASPFEPSYFEWYAPATMVMSAALILGVLHGRGPAAAVLAWAPLRWFGKVSYTLYLVHVFVFAGVAFHLGGEGRNVVRVVVANAIALAVTVVLHHLVEAPALRLKERWGAEVRTPLDVGLAARHDEPVSPAVAATAGASGRTPA